MNEDVTKPPRDAAVRDHTLHAIGDLIGSSPGGGDLKAVLVKHFQYVSRC